MSRSQIFFALVLLAFTVFTGVCFIRPDVLDLVVDLFKNPVSFQVSVDLMISLLLLLTFIWQDARKRGINPVPYVVFGITCGSFSPLLYMIHRGFRPVR